MPQVSSASQAMKIGKEACSEAGYEKIKITSTEYDDDEDVWNIDAEADDGETLISITIDADTGEVSDFYTE